MIPTALSRAIALLLILASACAYARPKPESEPDLVDAHKADIPTFTQLVMKSTTALIEQVSVPARTRGKYLVAFVGIENESREPLREAAAALPDKIREQLFKSGVFDMITMRLIEAARHEASLSRSEDLFIPSKRRKFVDVLESEGSTPDYLIWGKFTSMTSEGSEGLIYDKKQTRYRLSLEMVDLHNGLVAASSAAEVDKLYFE